MLQNQIARKRARYCIALLLILSFVGFVVKKDSWSKNRNAEKKPTISNSSMDRSAYPRPFVPKGMSKEYYPTVCNVTQVVRETVRNQSCSPVDKLVYLKTHKTNSATLASIIQRYGWIRGFSFAVPKHGIYFDPNLPFSRTMTRNNTNYNLIYSHARYNFKEMIALIPHSKHISMLRYPVAQLESAFSYFQLSKYFKLGKDKRFSNALEKFLKYPEYYVKETKEGVANQAHNGQIFDLGLEKKDFNDENQIKKKIAALEERMELILIKEYFDESLIILAKALCWDLSDMLYTTRVKKRGREKLQITGQMKDKILQWNKADLILYNHFNQTLWRKIEEYGPDFYQDLKTFRKMRSCLESNCTTTILGLDKNYVKPVLRMKSAGVCKMLFKTVSGMTETIRKHQEANETLESSNNLPL